ncbi:hypothetical protein Mal64_25460 [Pseudobythopirellula maris]|uniref:Glycosyl transferases group 1 n=1 Tax=Pseudobythopirellula maris TaxID=2527991 RepID=A0A5C5ZNF9_9BACT|nr:glycosyltransferase [Pseudobythopirellula maris]TWT89054.1 hypothetical protein Mal64_25460 [Pseudobythopirellula maris]
MQLAIIHYHLNRGGVAQVIQNHLGALAAQPAERRPVRVLIVHGPGRDAWPEEVVPGGAPFAIDYAELPELAYDAEPRADADRLAAALGAALAAEGFDRNATVLHTHNHALGKNASLPGALALLAGEGWRHLLQCHDFAEDNRPENYRHLAEALQAESLKAGDPHRLGAKLYPQAPQIHYATLTERDAAVLAEAGVAAERLSALPNPAAGLGSLPSQAEARGPVFEKLGLPAEARLVVYPVRGIRRKNLGEMLLLAALAPSDTWFAVTLAPKNPVELLSFDRWRRVAESLGLRCRFDTGGAYGVGFHDALAAADAIVTTSIAEGFGMVFLEAWLAGRPLIGRDLPEITREFRAAGMTLGGLWERLSVPLALLKDPRSAREGLRTVYQDTCEQYGVKPLGAEEAERRLGVCLEGDAIDFGQLTTAGQCELLAAAAQDAGVRRALLDANPGLAEKLRASAEASADEIGANARVVRSVYSAETLGERLAATYAEVLGSDSSAAVESLNKGEAILAHFLTPERVYHVRIEPWDPSKTESPS